MKLTFANLYTRDIFMVLVRAHRTGEVNGANPLQALVLRGLAVHEGHAKYRLTALGVSMAQLCNHVFSTSGKGAKQPWQDLMAS